MATAILREANPTYHSLAHPGVNAEGKTVKSLVDGICFVQGADPPHMIVVHHTTTAHKDLEKKWLHDPSKVKPRKISSSKAPAGDLIKAAELVAKERIRTPNLRATLVLTTNEEPDESLVRTVQTAGCDHRMEIDLWPRSRLGHFLDNTPSGQWLRRSFLGIEQELLSIELLHELSKKSIEINSQPDNPEAWVPRTLDTMLATGIRNDVTFLVAGSGLGKSVACYRRLTEHVEGGRFGIILPHEVVALAMTLEQALATTLRLLHPLLATVGPSALSFCLPERPLLLVVEDINRSGQTQALVEKIASWSCLQVKNRPTNQPGKNPEDASRWRLICPLWPEVLASLGEQARERVEPFIIAASGFTENEGQDAVLARARLAGCKVTALEAETISRALGHDPLLIALHDQSITPDPHRAIGQFVEGSLSRAAKAGRDLPAAEYRQTLRALAKEMLARRQIELNWRDLRDWPALQGETLWLIGYLAKEGELIRITGLSEDQRLSFRHDRVRDWILADAAADLDRRGFLPDQVVSEPYFAEIMGAVLVWGQTGSSFLERAASLNPLALFHSFRLFGRGCEQHCPALLEAINAWLDDPATHDPSHLHLRWEALAMLADTDSPAVPALVQKFRDRTTSGQLARFRNGDLSGGIELCSHLNPGTGALWRDARIEHAKARYGGNLTKELDRFLRQTDLNSTARIGALRMAGHIATSSLASAIEVCWTSDHERNHHLADYLWAFGECCGDDPARLLGPVCDAWAALPDRTETQGLLPPRESLAAHELRWAFRKWPPLAAIDYFIERASQDDLRWPITYMLHSIDHPKAVSLVVQEIAAIQRRIEGTRSINHFAQLVGDEWERAQQKEGRPMSRASRDYLLGLWQDETNEKHLRKQSFSLWAATEQLDDLDILRSIEPSVEFFDRILWERLIRGDQQAIPAMIDKLADDSHGYWWQCGRYIWSPELTEALDRFLAMRGAHTERVWGESLNSDWIIHEMIMRLPASQAEEIILKHWDHLRFAPCFVQTALWFSTPCLVEAARASINECPEPSKLMEHLASNCGIHIEGRTGLASESQLLALAPYLDLLSTMDIRFLWDECNANSWYAIRRKLLDSRLQPPFLELETDDHSASMFDEMIEKNRLLWVYHWIDRYLKAGVPWSKILASMTAWLDKRRSFEALQAVATAIQLHGTREDLDYLKIYENMPEPAAGQLIANTRFAVRRRSLH